MDVKQVLKSHLEQARAEVVQEYAQVIGQLAGGADPTDLADRLAELMPKLGIDESAVAADLDAVTQANAIRQKAADLGAEADMLSAELAEIEPQLAEMRPTWDRLTARAAILQDQIQKSRRRQTAIGINLRDLRSKFRRVEKLLG